MKLNYVSILSLIFSNLYCIYGVKYLGWSVLSTILIYFIESIIIGLFTFAKTFYVEYEDNFSKVPMSSSYRRERLVGVGFIFIFCFSILSVLLNEFIFKNIDTLALISFSGILTFTLSHAISFYTNYLRNREFENSTFIGLMFKFMFMRMFPIAFFIFTASTLLSQEGSSEILINFIVFKTIADLLLHILEHRFSYFKVNTQN
jgi:hypothetical protein